MVDIDPATGAPIHPTTPTPAPATTHVHTSAPFTSHDIQANQGQQAHVATPVHTIESFEKKVVDKQTALTVANEAANKAHGELMEAQRELSFAKAH